ncbi:MAG: hypothetical protein JWM11_748 [Planctomycetaceae bacterium]|nr:hypothetical protein [Planctomycetaceae bacterium]
MRCFQPDVMNEPNCHATRVLSLNQALHELAAFKRVLFVIVSLCLVLNFSGLASAAEESRVVLTQLVPANAGLVIEVRGLTDQAKKLAQSSIAQRIQQHSAWQQVLNSSEIKKLQELDQGVRQITEHSLMEWLDTVVGREAILAISPSELVGGQAEKPQFLLLTRLKQREDLNVILAAWNKLEGRQETSYEHRGQPYFSRQKTGQPDSTVFYAQLDDVVVLSDRKSSMTQVLDLGKAGPTANSLANSQRFQKTFQLLNPAAAIRVFIQPAVWHDKAQVEGKASEVESKASGDAGERFVRQAWSNCHAVGVGIRFESGIIAEAVVLSDVLANHPQWRKFVERTAGSPAFLARVPRTAVLAFGGRHDLATLSEWGLSQLPPEQIKQLKSVRQMVRGLLMGRDLLDDVLPQLPADFGGFIVPRNALDLKAAPVDGLIAVSLPARESPDLQPSKAPYRNALSNAVQTGFSMLTAFHNAASSDDASLEDEDLNGVALHWIDSLGPYQPAYALSQDYLLVASSPRLIRNFLTQSATETWASDSEMRKFRDACFADASQVLAFHGRLARDFVGQHREFFVQQLVAAHKLSPAEASKRLDRMLEWVQLSDAVVIATTFSADHVKIVLGIAIDGTVEKR